MTSVPSMSGRPRSRTIDVGVLVGGGPQRRGAVRGEHDAVAVGAEVDPQRAQDLRVVVDDQHLVGRSSACGLRATGRATTTVSPPPGVSSAVSVPPITSVNPRATARPSPTPSRPSRSLGSAPSRRNGANRLSRSRFGHPGPGVDDAQLHAVAVGAGRAARSGRRPRSAGRCRRRSPRPAPAARRRRARRGATRRCRASRGPRRRARPAPAPPPRRSRRARAAA